MHVAPTPTALPTQPPQPTATPAPAPARSAGKAAEHILAENGLALILLDRQEEHLKGEWLALTEDQQTEILVVIMGYLALSASYCDLSVEAMTKLAHEHGPELETVGYTVRNDLRPRTFLLYLLGEIAAERQTRGRSCDEILGYMASPLLDNERHRRQEAALLAVDPIGRASAWRGDSKGSSPLCRGFRAWTAL